MENENKKITNPLTIVGLFSGVAEIAASVALVSLSPELQAIFIWFVILFPILLVILFFMTWNFNPTVLYSPGDYRNEENFLLMLSKKIKFENDIKELKPILLEINQELKMKLDKTKTESNKTIYVDLSDIEYALDDKMNYLMEKIDETQDNASEFINMIAM